MNLRKSGKNIREIPKKKGRILFFDVLRIMCVALIVYDHSQYDLLQGFNKIIFSDGYGPFHIFTSGLQGYAVYGLIFISGAVLEYNYNDIKQFTGYLQFVLKRFIRLYPAFWMSLLLGILTFPALLQNNVPGAILEFTGYFVILGKNPVINNMGWFIAAIFSLYLIFPVLSRFIRKYQLTGLLGLCVLSWGLRSIVLTYDLIPLDVFWRWFPLFNAFEFSLGIYIVQNRLYPKKENIYPSVRKCSDLSFYVFLFHVIIIRVFILDIKQLRPLTSFDNLIAMNNLNIGYTIFYLQMLAAVLIVSWIAMATDLRIQKWILEQESIKKFLST